ncbi:hypothetical protein [Malacoplasma iowae]|uniref:Uncharacterized protein n=2 Tax=Malacoplasma iowae TaxID=2116 RepID=A0A084U3L8_MALIO|nr:hypothetical protein [Malacoplasma iowae]VEU62525.1 Uncharacterised protein [Mycoplasmopsis fermentans]EGZ31402.1 hypothetical protein GUU_02147 [Malacoplasma iowae 695]KFB07554.1 hypothetical protein P271_396 [Malacoplasma iowae DK-CPA]QHG89733.1 hypothetical protein EER00_02385 [Malacoplasma iowae 695]WPL35474.1 hypothetical protein QX180_04045 [Malacoplasma iowae]
MKFNTINSSSLEYIYVDEEVRNSSEFYEMRIKFKIKNKLYRYLIKKELWNNSLRKYVIDNKGLNIGKLMWGYILSGEIIQFKTYTEIMLDND